MADRIFLDTNILLYAISYEPADVAKQAIAAKLLDRDDCILSMQVLHEFIYQATRPYRPSRLSDAEAWAFVTAWRRFPVQESTLATLDRAYDILDRTGYSIWDCLIVAAAQAQGCGILYTEDMQDGRIIDRLRIVNPFR